MATTGHEQEIIDVAGLKASLKKGGNKAVYNEAICSTAGATAAKVTNTTPPSFSLVSGATIIVKFTYAISVANATLKVGDADAKPIYYRGAALEANKVKAGDKVLLRYDGTSFNIIGSLGETYENKQAASGGTDVSLVTTGEKYAWNQKQDAIAFNTAYNASTNKAATMSDITKANVGLGNVDNTSDATKKSNFTGSIASENTGFVTGGAAYTALAGKADLVDGKVPSDQLPSYVDDVLEYSSTSTFPSTGETGKIYVAIDTNKTYRWSGTEYTQIKGDLALGETSSTAYRGDRGKTAYDHSQVTSGNPHNVSKSDVGLGNVGNFKAVSTEASQGLSSTEQSNARANIGAGTSSFSGSYSDLSNKPNLDSIADGSTRKLADYLPLSGGTMTGNLTMSGTNILMNGANNRQFGFIFGSAKQHMDVGYNFANADGSGAYFRSSDYSGEEGCFGFYARKTSSNFCLLLGTPSGTLTWGGNTVYHSGNLTSLPASDVSAWAKASTKPSYTLDEVSDGSTRKLSNYLPLSGGTLTGSVTFANSTWNVVGDDSEIGDIDVSGTLGVKGVNGQTAIAFVNKDNSRYTRVIAQVVSSNINVTLPSSSGTLALVSQIPTNTNQLTNGAGYITSSGSCNYATSAGSAPASDVYDWAKASTKPTYTLSEVGASMSVSAISSNTSSSCSITGSGNAGKSETIIYTNSGSSDLTVTVPTTYSTPDGAAIELTCKAGGYCEVSYLNIGGTIYARGL